ncbi:hypothetical protein L7F22_052049 [Adiantum nelumboides]|nr:hypothetical protein [Adiantum nelumboides]
MEAGDIFKVFVGDVGLQATQINKFCSTQSTRISFNQLLTGIWQAFLQHFSFAHHFLQAPSSSESKARRASSCTLRTSSRLAGISASSLAIARLLSSARVPLNRAALLEARSILGWKQTVLEAVQPVLKRLRITPTDFTQFLLAFNLCKPVRLNTFVICSSLLRRQKSSGVFFKPVELLACHLKALQGAKMEGHAA